MARPVNRPQSLNKVQPAGAFARPQRAPNTAAPAVEGSQQTTQQVGLGYQQTIAKQSNYVRGSLSPFTETIATPYGNVPVKVTPVQLLGGGQYGTRETIVGSPTYTQNTSTTSGGFTQNSTQNYSFQISGTNLQLIPTTSSGTITYNGTPVATAQNGVLKATSNTISNPVYGTVSGQNQYLGTVYYTPSVSGNQVGFQNTGFTSANVTISGSVPSSSSPTGKIGYSYQTPTSFNASTGQISLSAQGANQFFTPSLISLLSTHQSAAQSTSSFSVALGAFGVLNPLNYGTATTSTANPLFTVLNPYNFNPATPNSAPITAGPLSLAGLTAASGSYTISSIPTINTGKLEGTTTTSVNVVSNFKVPEVFLLGPKGIAAEFSALGPVKGAETFGSQLLGIFKQQPVTFSVTTTTVGKGEFPTTTTSTTSSFGGQLFPSQIYAQSFIAKQTALANAGSGNKGLQLFTNIAATQGTVGEYLYSPQATLAQRGEAVGIIAIEALPGLAYAEPAEGAAILSGTARTLLGTALGTASGAATTFAFGATGITARPTPLQIVEGGAASGLIVGGLDVSIGGIKNAFAIPGREDFLNPVEQSTQLQIKAEFTGNQESVIYARSSTLTSLETLEYYGSKPTVYLKGLESPTVYQGEGFQVGEGGRSFAVSTQADDFIAAYNGAANRVIEINSFGAKPNLNLKGLPSSNLFAEEPAFTSRVQYKGITNLDLTGNTKGFIQIEYTGTTSMASTLKGEGIGAQPSDISFSAKAYTTSGFRQALAKTGLISAERVTDLGTGTLATGGETASFVTIQYRPSGEMGLTSRSLPKVNEAIDLQGASRGGFLITKIGQSELGLEFSGIKFTSSGQTSALKITEVDEFSEFDLGPKQGKEPIFSTPPQKGANGEFLNVAKPREAFVETFSQAKYGKDFIDFAKSYTATKADTGSVAKPSGAVAPAEQVSKLALVPTAPTEEITGAATRALPAGQVNNAGIFAAARYLGIQQGARPATASKTSFTTITGIKVGLDIGTKSGFGLKTGNLIGTGIKTASAQTLKTGLKTQIGQKNAIDKLTGNKIGVDLLTGLKVTTGLKTVQTQKTAQKTAQKLAVETATATDIFEPPGLETFDVGLFAPVPRRPRQTPKVKTSTAKAFAPAFKYVPDITSTKFGLSTSSAREQKGFRNLGLFRPQFRKARK